MTPPPDRRDWVGGRGTIIAWGLPVAALIGAIFVGPDARTAVWAAALAWMGIACLANARRCGRTHCYFTGPFFLVMAGAVLLHGLNIVWLGREGWIWLGAATAAGTALLWWGPERMRGKYSRPEARP